MLIDSHAHLDSQRYSDDLEPVLRRAAQAGVTGVLTIGIGEGPSEMHQARDVVRRFTDVPGIPKLWASAGIYPHATHLADENALLALDALLVEPEVIACGEIGLDYYHEGAPHDLQARVFVQQMEIAARRHRPILIHCRPAENDDACWSDLMDLLRQHWAATNLGGILHCFSGTADHARQAMEMGFLISFAGQITYPRLESLRQVASALPLEALLVETDAPYLAPIPLRGQRNEPAYVVHTAAMLAQIFGCTSAEIGQITAKNFCRLFGLPLAVGD